MNVTDPFERMKMVRRSCYSRIFGTILIFLRAQGSPVRGCRAEAQARSDYPINYALTRFVRSGRRTHCNLACSALAGFEIRIESDFCQRIMLTNFGFREYKALADDDQLFVHIEREAHNQERFQTPDSNERKGRQRWSWNGAALSRG